MAFEKPLERVGQFPADIDMSGIANPGSPNPQYIWQFAPVWLAAGTNSSPFNSTVGGAALVAQGALTTPAYGVLQNTPVVGEAGEVVRSGITKCQVVTAITVVGGPINLTAGGAQPATTGMNIDGWALETGPAGSLVTIQLERAGKA